MDPELRPAWSAQCMPGHLGLCSETLSWVNNNFLSRSCRRTIDRCRKNYLVPCLHSTDQVSQGIQGTKEFRSCSWDKTRPCNLALHCYFKFKQTPSMDRNDYNSIHPKEIRHILNITMMHVYTRTHICMCVCMCVYICMNVHIGHTKNWTKAFLMCAKKLSLNHIPALLLFSLREDLPAFPRLFLNLGSYCLSLLISWDFQPLQQGLALQSHNREVASNHTNT
jgi:hypothetical protein